MCLCLLWQKTNLARATEQRRELSDFLPKRTFLLFINFITFIINIPSTSLLLCLAILQDYSRSLSFFRISNIITIVAPHGIIPSTSRPKPHSLEHRDRRLTLPTASFVHQHDRNLILSISRAS
jgi:hypothetical protein